MQYSPYLSMHDTKEMLEALATSKFPSPNHSPAKQFRVIWNIAVGDEPHWDNPEDS